MYTIPANISTLAATIIPIAIPAFLLPLIPPPEESSPLSSTPKWFIEVESSGEGAGDEPGLKGDGAGGDEPGLKGYVAGGDESRGELAGGWFGADIEGDGVSAGDGDGDGDGDGGEPAVT